MARIVCNIIIGDYNQDIYIESEKYSGKKTLERYSMPLKDFPKFILDQPEINEIYLFGNSDYAKKIEKETKELEQSLYAKDTKKFYYMT